MNQGLLASYVKRMPEQPRGLGSLDLLSNTPETHAHFCRVKCCPHHNDGFQIFGDGDEGWEEATIHGLEFHMPFYYSLPEEDQETTGWFKCMEGCNYLSLGL